VPATKRNRWLLGSVVLVATAQAHVAPSVDDNNRYLKVTPLGDRIRLAYTVFFGEVPGRAQRTTIDTNKDGAISDDEANAFGAKIAADVAPALDITVDGVERPVTWNQVVVGMGTPATSAGAFSIDLVAWLCLPSPRGHHALQLRDHFRIPRPGETELRVDDSPGVKIEHARVGHAEIPEMIYKMVGPGGPLSDDGLDLVFTADDRAPIPSDHACAAAAPPPAKTPMLAIALVALAACGGGALVLVIRHKRRK
jgi:hypothetical protein